MSKIYQFKIKLLGSKPVIWRRIQMHAKCSFWDLHVIIRDCFVWLDNQPHYFKIVQSKNNEHIINSFLDNYEDNLYPLSWNVPVKKYFSHPKYKIYYVYGADQEFTHLITLEKTLYKKIGVRYPRCLAGKGITKEGSEDYTESSIGLMLEAMQEFKPDSVVVTKGDRALAEHKVYLFDSLYC